MTKHLIAALLLTACGAPAPAPDAGEVEDAGTTIDGGPPDAGTGPATLSSAVLTDGGTFAVRYTCTDATTTGRVSPPLTWTAIPNARSYALVMTDTSINLIHWVLWDVDATTLQLAEGVSNVAQPPSPAGAKQTTSYDGLTFGYRGPCPPSPHVYRFELHGLDVATLPGVSTTSTRAQVQAALTAHVIETVALTSSYGP
ncbi:MAG: YbhB/YbcL family Raf kinase inhibitor-like protein [Archangium sp.]|nr:YbhB/YbcL family Raf kinase inhibitor-like protein [Archangium sp.]MDP3154322.1 YbhB/YbcL family Raf kinase inhibitor-like protein [Archangium sp.]MDP3569736.1 YbhB/YbcL family Raf kinase inhibitor-like protein [Archangium sp.]